MNIQEKTKDIREKCIEANPEIKTRLVGGEFYQRDHKIRLADVLLAIDKFYGNMFIDEMGCFVKPKRKEFTYNYVIKNNRNIKWNLKDNNLENQSEECKNFIYEMLK